jgi:tetratricopeptide (TPR) repeat protein
MVLVIDADEALAPSSRPYLREYLAAGEDVGHIAARRNHRPGATGPAPVDHAVRLFPNRPAYRYRHRVHETIDESILAGSGRLRRSGLMLEHYLPEEAAQRAKGEWYLSLLRADVAQTPHDAGRLAFLAAEYHQLGRYAEATEVAERIAELCPDDFEAQWHAALYHHAYAGDAERTRRDLAAALRLRPDDPEALALLQAVEAR